MTVARREDPALAIAIVHHANQYVITDGYDNREGITELVQGREAILRLSSEDLRIAMAELYEGIDIDADAAA